MELDELPIYDSMMEYAQEVLEDHVDDGDYKEWIRDSDCKEEFENLAHFEPTYKIYEYKKANEDLQYNFDEIMHYQFWRDKYNNEDEVSAEHLLLMIKYVDYKYGKNFCSEEIGFDNVDEIWKYVFFICLDWIENDLENYQTRMMEKKDYEYEDKILIIQRAWKMCRWNPEYKMCEKCQLKDLENICEEFGKEFII